MEPHIGGCYDEVRLISQNVISAIQARGIGKAGGRLTELIGQLESACRVHAYVCHFANGSQKVIAVVGLAVPQ